MTLLDSILAFERSQEHLQRKVLLVRGKLGLPNGTVEGSREGYVWVRLYGHMNQPVQAYNDKTKYTHNLDVYVAVDPYRTEGLAPYTVMGTVGSVGTSMSALLDNKSKVEENIGRIARALEWSSNLGRDAFNVFDRAIVPLRVQALETAAMQVYVNPGYYTYRGVYHFFPGGVTVTITAPVTGTRLDLVYLDATTNEIGVTTGTAATDIYSTPAVPALSAGQIPLAHLLLGPDASAINERNIYDMRPFLAADGVPWLDGDQGDALVNDGAGGAEWSPQATPVGLLHVSAQAVSGSTYSQDSSSWTTIRSLSSIELTKACRVCLQAQAIGYTGSAGNPVEIQIYQGDTALGYPSRQPATSYSSLGCTYDYDLAAGTYTWNLKYRRNGGSGTVYVAYIVFNVKAFTTE